MVAVKHEANGRTDIVPMTEITATTLAVAIDLPVMISICNSRGEDYDGASVLVLFLAMMLLGVGCLQAFT